MLLFEQYLVAEAKSRVVRADGAAVQDAHGGRRVIPHAFRIDTFASDASAPIIAFHPAGYHLSCSFLLALSHLIRPHPATRHTLPI